MSLFFVNQGQAGRALEEIGTIQRAISEGSIVGFDDLQRAADEISDHIRALMTYFGPSANTYKHLIEPLMEWVVYDITPKYIDPREDAAAAPGFRQFHHKLEPLFKEYEYLSPRD